MATKPGGGGGLGRATKKRTFLRLPLSNKYLSKKIVFVNHTEGICH